MGYLNIFSLVVSTYLILFIFINMSYMFYYTAFTIVIAIISSM